MLIKILLLICNWIAAVTLYAIGTMLITFLMKEANITDQVTRFILYFGLGVLLHYPCKKLFKI